MCVQLYDTTLRDGTQGEGISLSVEDKLSITTLLDELGVAYIEGGWPGSNPKDAAYFDAVQSLTLEHAKIAAFGMTCRVNSDPATDGNIKALLDANTPVVTVVGKTSMLHVEEVLMTTPEENLRIIRESIAYLKAQGKEVIYDAEHFFDGYKLNPEYSLQTLAAAAEGGADMLVLCDTNGGTMFWEIEEFFSVVRERFPTISLGMHAHNDSELGVANSLAAVRAGAVHVQGTFNGYGERCGNANLVSIIPDLEMKMGVQCLPNEDALRRLTYVSRSIAEIANQTPDNSQPYVGKSAFAHKGGIHVAAMRRCADSYQHIDPEQVGNDARFLVSDLSGRGNILMLAEAFNLDTEDDTARRVLHRIKDMENEGYAFEGAEASVAMMLRRERADYKTPFRLIDYMVLVAHRDGRGIVTEATVKLDVDGQELYTVADGNGPVNALDRALRKALLPVYPQLAQFHLADYKVRIIDAAKATAATTRVLIDTRNGTKRWSTVGASTNIIEASWQAVVDSIEYGLLMLHGDEETESTEAEVVHGH
jgi:2-isopropylmalate synthase